MFDLRIFIFSEHRLGDVNVKWGRVSGGDNSQSMEQLLPGHEVVSSNYDLFMTHVRFLSRASLGMRGTGAPSFSQWVGLDKYICSNFREYLGCTCEWC